MFGLAGPGQPYTGRRWGASALPFALGGACRSVYAALCAPEGQGLGPIALTCRLAPADFLTFGGGVHRSGGTHEACY